MHALQRSCCLLAAAAGRLRRRSAAEHAHPGRRPRSPGARACRRRGRSRRPRRASARPTSCAAPARGGDRAGRREPRAPVRRSAARRARRRHAQAAVCRRGLRARRVPLSAAAKGPSRSRLYVEWRVRAERRRSDIDRAGGCGSSALASRKRSAASGREPSDGESSRRSRRRPWRWGWRTRSRRRNRPPASPSSSRSGRAPRRRRCRTCRRASRSFRRTAAPRVDIVDRVGEPRAAAPRGRKLDADRVCRRARHQRPGRALRRRASG